MLEQTQVTVSERIYTVKVSFMQEIKCLDMTCDLDISLQHHTVQLGPPNKREKKRERQKKILVRHSRDQKNKL